MIEATAVEPRLRLLLIEDDEVDRRGVRRMLQRGALRAELDEADTVAGALAALEGAHYDCVLMDYRLPDGEGLDLIRRLEGDGGVPAPVVVLTGHHEEELATACLTAGAQDYLVKGKFDADALTRSIRYARERWRLRQELVDKAAALERSNVELERFAYVASHDLQEPLRTIRGFGERLAARYGERLDEPGREYLDRMLAATGRMQDQIRDLLALSRISTSEAVPTRVELSDALERARADLAARLETEGAELVAGPLPAVLGNEPQLRRLLLNLVGNALKFRSEERPPRVEVTAEALPEEPGWVEVQVRDNGIGFEGRMAEAIFRPFKRLHRRSAYAGTGIGLAICKAIVERHGGRIRAEGRPGEGATFAFTLPLAR